MERLVHVPWHDLLLPKFSWAEKVARRGQSRETTKTVSPTAA